MIGSFLRAYNDRIDDGAGRTCSPTRPRRQPCLTGCAAHPRRAPERVGVRGPLAPVATACGPGATPSTGPNPAWRSCWEPRGLRVPADQQPHAPGSAGADRRLADDRPRKPPSTHSLEHDHANARLRQLRTVTAALTNQGPPRRLIRPTPRFRSGPAAPRSSRADLVAAGATMQKPWWPTSLPARASPCVGTRVGIGEACSAPAGRPEQRQDRRCQLATARSGEAGATPALTGTTCGRLNFGGRSYVGACLRVARSPQARGGLEDGSDICHRESVIVGTTGSAHVVSLCCYGHWRHF